MSRLFPRAAGLPLLAVALILTTAGCGGFGKVEAPALATPLQSYVALGDGFAAGPYVGQTPQGGCLRGSDNYPAQVAKALKITKFTDVTCTGATTSSLTHSSRVGKGTLPAQIDAISATTDLISVNAGIMDHDLVSTMFRDCVALPCGSALAGQVFIDDLKALGTSLTAALRTIQNKAPKAFLVVVGYPQLMPAQKSCAKLPAMSAAQLNAANIVLRQLNADVLSSARQTGATFVDLADLSADHTACSAVPWVNGKAGVPGHSIAYHPLAAEQAAVATAVATAVRGR